MFNDVLLRKANRKFWIASRDIIKITRYGYSAIPNCLFLYSCLSDGDRIIKVG